jgi:hypothetical protein
MVRFKSPAGEQWQPPLLLWLKVVKNEARKVRDKDVSRYLVPPLFTREVFDVFESL